MQLPSLTALRAFEAVARNGSVKDAAAELFVTPGAVSQQVKALEGELSATLFRRESQGLRLTEQGAGLYTPLREAFATIGAAVERFREGERSGPLTVSVVPSFAAKWLVPRLGRFYEQHPTIDVRISATLQMVDFGREDVDVGIRLGMGEYPGLHSEWLLSESVFPVCSPRLLQRVHPLRQPADLAHFTLLHDEGYDDWREWLRVHGVDGVLAERGPVFNDAAMALQMAIEGQGVAMARGELVVTDLAEGRLVKPFDLPLTARHAYYVVCPPGAAERPKIAAFRAWLQDEARREREQAGEEPALLPPDGHRQR